MAEPEYTKLYYSIGEVAEMLNVNTSLIRYWEKEFSAIRPKKNRRGNRLFTVKDIETLKYIYHLVKVDGHTLEGVKKLLKAREGKKDGKYHTLQTLERLKSFLTELRDELDKA